ncbi:hypothetical protein D3C86_1542310 [compost metagenome]
MAAPAFSEDGSSAMATNTPSRVFRLASFMLFSSISKLCSCFGNTLAAALRTPAAGWLSALLTTCNASAFDPSNTPRPCNVHNACTAGLFNSISSTFGLLMILYRSGSTDSFFDSTSKRCAVIRQNILSFSNAATSPGRSSLESFIAGDFWAFL